MHNVFENSLPDQLLAFGSREIVNAVFLQQNHFATFKFKLSVIRETFHFDEQRLWRLQVGCQVDPVGERHHVVGKKLRIVVEPLNLRLSERFFNVGTERWA